MQRRIAPLALLTAAVLAAITGCSSGSTGSSGGAASESSFGKCAVTGKVGSISIKPTVPGVLTVATNLPSPAWWHGVSPTKIDGGYEYCLAADIAHRAGLKRIIVKNVSFDGLVAGQIGNFDIALAQVSITDARKKVVDFSEPYYQSMIGVLANADSKITAENITKKRLGVQVATTAVDFVGNELKPSEKPATYAETESMVAAVQAGQIDAALQDTAIMLGFANASHGLLKVVGQYNTGENYGAIYPKGSTNGPAMDSAIAAMKKDGTLAGLAKKWLAPAFGGNPDDIPVFNG